MQLRHSLILLLLCSTAYAEEPVFFADPALQAAVEEALWIAEPTLGDMLTLTDLRCIRCDIVDLTGLEYATNLECLWLRLNHITDITPLAGLTGLYELHLPLNDISDLSPLFGLVNLEVLHLYGCEISDVFPLSGLTSLRTLLLDGNTIEDVSALSGLVFLEVLDLEDNRIGDISALAELKGLTRLDLRRNPLGQEACEIHVPAIRSNNPGIKLDHPCDRWRLKLSSTRGGVVVRPGEGEFFYWDGETVSLEARADPGFVFAGWSGGWGTTSNPASLAMFENYEIRANFVSALDVVCVDDNAANDPAPADAAGSDPQENGTPEHPFDTIQEAIDAAADGATVLVRPGLYAENIRFPGKRITVTGVDPNGPGPDCYPVIEGREAEPVVRFVGGADPNCLLMGFVITRGRGRAAGALLCRGSSPTVANCLIVGNRATGGNGAVVHCTDGSIAFVNCTITDNYVPEEGSVVWLIDSDVLMTNCIVDRSGSAGVLLDGDGNLSVSHTSVAGGWPGPGNLDVDPLFVRRGYWAAPDDPGIAVDPEYVGAVWIEGDYHLQSEAGRWYPPGEAWVNDGVTSLCIDAGDPAGPVGAEPAPNAGIINIGAYGGTTQASKSKINP